MRFSHIVAQSLNRGIGYKNNLLFRIKEDMQFFKKTTTGHPVIMGRNTFDSIGKPLPGRFNVVITSRPIPTYDNLVAVRSIGDARKIIEEKYSNDGNQEVFIIGGMQIYQNTIDIIDRVYLTTVKKEHARADAFYPELRQPTPTELGWGLKEVLVDNPELKIEIYDLMYAGSNTNDVWENFRC